MCIDAIDPRSDLVSKQDFLCKADGEDGKPHRHVVPLDAERVLGKELRNHLVVVDDRAGNEMGEDCHEFAVCQEGAILRLPAVRIDEICCLREREERDAERQHDVRQVEEV